MERWDPALCAYITELSKTKPVILTGDLNVVHLDLDMYNPTVRAKRKKETKLTSCDREGSK